MNVLSLKPFIKPDITTFILMLISYLGIWMVNILLLPEFSYSGMDLRDNRWPVASHLLALLLLITINSILLRRFVLHFSIIRTKSFLPVFFFLTFSVVWPEMRTNLFPHFFLTIFLISIELFFGMYRNHRAVEPAFLGSLLISLTSLIHPFYLLIFPILWIGWIILKSMSVKSLLASFTGIAVFTTVGFGTMEWNLGFHRFSKRSTSQQMQLSLFRSRCSFTLAYSFLRVSLVSSDYFQNYSTIPYKQEKIYTSWY